MESMESTIQQKIAELYSYCNTQPCDKYCPLYFKCHKDGITDEAFEHMDVKTLDECWKIMIGEKRTKMRKAPDQTAKADAGKPDIYLVPPEIMEAIAVVRQYGNEKYGDPNNWKNVEIDRYYSALERHMFAWRKWKENPNNTDAQFDQESGIKHLWHAACNLAFMIALEERDEP